MTVTLESIPSDLHPPFDPSWEDRASCAEERLEAFFPVARSSDRADAIYAGLAVRFCHNCPVRPACLWTALDGESGSHHNRHGLFGALSPKQRTNRALVLLVLAGGIPPLPTVKLCACGCATQLPVGQFRGRPRRFIEGHQPHRVVAA